MSKRRRIRTGPVMVGLTSVSLMVMVYILCYLLLTGNLYFGAS